MPTTRGRGVAPAPVADADRGLSFVQLDAHAKGLVGPAARERGQNGEGIVIPLFSNRGFVPFLRNLVCSLRRLQINNWMVIAMDNETCPELMRTSGHGEQSACVYPYANEGVTSQRGVAIYRSVAFNRMVMQRPLWVHFLLQQGHHILQCDLDIAWLKDPMPLLRHGRVVSRPRLGDTYISATDVDELLRQHPNGLGNAFRVVRDPPDMVFQSEQAYGLNGGFYYARPTANTIAFFDDWLLQLQATVNRPTFEEQHALNGALNRLKRNENRSLKFARLSEREFPNGKMWWQYPQEVDKRIAYVVHANWNKNQKKSRMIRDKLWFLDESDKRCVDGFDPFVPPGCSKLCVPLGYSGVGGGKYIMKTCDQLNHDDDHFVRRTLSAWNVSRKWPSRLANVFWHPHAYSLLENCHRRLTTVPMATEVHEAAFGVEARVRHTERPPAHFFELDKPW